MEDILAIVFLFGGGTLAAIAYSPIGKAYADKLRGRIGRTAEDVAEQAEMREALNGLRREVAELAERVDFTERLLARAKGAEQLRPGDVAR